MKRIKIDEKKRYTIIIKEENSSIVINHRTFFGKKLIDLFGIYG